MSNYQKHLDYDLKEAIKTAEFTRKRAREKEERLKQAAEIVDLCQKKLQTAVNYRNRCNEFFREAHSEDAHARQRLGELQDEKFATEEEREDQRH